jgi:hypothetical protein
VTGAGDGLMSAARGASHAGCSSALQIAAGTGAAAGPASGTRQPTGTASNEIPVNDLGQHDRRTDRYTEPGPTSSVNPYTVVAEGPVTSGGPPCTSRGPAVYLAGNDSGQRPDVPWPQAAGGRRGRKGSRPAHGRPAGRGNTAGTTTCRRRGRDGIGCRPVRAGRVTRRWPPVPCQRRGRRPRPGWGASGTAVASW